MAVECQLHRESGGLGRGDIWGLSLQAERQPRKGLAVGHVRQLWRVLVEGVNRVASGRWGEGSLGR